MDARTDSEQFGTLIDASTLQLRRRLPGPIERVWAYLTDSDLRRQWLAAGDMSLMPGTSFELVWRNDELSASADERPEGFPVEHRASCRMTDVQAPRRLGFTWPGVGEVTIQLDPAGEDVLMTITHRRLADRSQILLVGAGWHVHADILAARLAGTTPPSLWNEWVRLRSEYERRVTA